MDHTEWRNHQEKVHVEIDGHEFNLAYTEFGDGEQATLFLHGIPTWGFLFHEVHDAVDHAIIPDMPGYGYTEHRGEGGYDRSIRTMEAAVLSLLDELDHETVNVVGHDLGGGAALRLAINTDVVDRLVLSNAACYDAWPVEFIHSLGLPAASRDWTREDAAEKAGYAISSSIYGDEADHMGFIEGMKAPFLSPDHEPARLSRNAIATNTNHTLELSPTLGTVDAPTLLLWGGEDILVGTEWADRLAEEFSDVDKRYLDRAYHWVMADRPTAYQEALADFLG